MQEKDVATRALTSLKEAADSAGKDQKKRAKKALYWWIFSLVCYVVTRFA